MLYGSVVVDLLPLHIKDVPEDVVKSVHRCASSVSFALCTSKQSIINKCVCDVCVCV